MRAMATAAVGVVLAAVMAGCGGGGGPPSPDPCGDGAVQPGEQCDGPDLGGQSCLGLGFTGGALTCGPTCRFVTAACTGEACGDGTTQADEECDDGNVADGDGCSATCGLEQPGDPLTGTGWFAPGGTIGEGAP